MAEKLLLKEQLFNAAKVKQIASEIYSVYPQFDKKTFTADVLTKLPELELKARIAWISECLKKYLPSNYRRAVGVLLRALPSPNDPTLADDDFGDFIYATYSEYVAMNGCTNDVLGFSLRALRELTTRFSSEYAIRYFINAFPENTIKELLKWSKDDHYHVRRLCSEGTRPKLPWSQKINLPVTAPLPILDNLFLDPTRFVTRSVANHLNDISKIDPELVIDTLAKWRKSGKQRPAEMEYIVRHALRTLIKQGNRRALALLGFSHAVRVSVTNFLVPKKVKMNSTLEFSFKMQAQENADIIADYIINFQNKAGKLNSKKVFKLKQFSLKKDQSMIISQRHMLREHMTTRTLYKGQHEIELQINGKTHGKRTFELM